MAEAKKTSPAKAPKADDQVIDYTKTEPQTTADGVTIGENEPVDYTNARPGVVAVGEKPFDAAPPVLSREDSNALIETTGQNQVKAVAPTGVEPAPERICVVDGCQWTRIPPTTDADGNRHEPKICSAHEMHFYRDGTPRGNVTRDRRLGDGVVVEKTSSGGTAMRYPGMVAHTSGYAAPPVASPAVDRPELSPPDDLEGASAK